MSRDSPPTDPAFRSPRPGPSRRRLAARLAGSAVLVLVLLVAFRDLALATWPLVWPPTDPLSRWVGLATVVVGGWVVLPGAVGGLLGDWLYDRFG